MSNGNRDDDTWLSEGLVTVIVMALVFYAAWVLLDAVSGGLT